MVRVGKIFWSSRIKIIEGCCENFFSFFFNINVRIKKSYVYEICFVVIWIKDISIIELIFFLIYFDMLEESNNSFLNFIEYNDFIF